MSQESTASSDDRSPAEILQSYGWVEDLPNSEIRKLWRQYWKKGKGLAPAFTKCPPEWHEALDYMSKDSDPELIELAERFGVLDKEYARKLPAIAYYDCRHGRKCGKSDGRIIDREDYRRLYEEIKEIRDKRFESEVIVTGQPSGGKTYFMYYFLIHLLAQAEPVLLSSNVEEHYLFLPDNVWKLKAAMTNPDYSSRRDFLHVVSEGTWALVDCDKLSAAPSHAFSGELVFFPVFFSPPYKATYESLLAAPHPPLLRVMQPMTSREIVACISEAKDKSCIALERLLKHFGIFGQAPSFCYESMKGRTHFQTKIRLTIDQIRSIDLPQLQHILGSLNRTDLGSPNHTRVNVQWNETFRALFTMHCSQGEGYSPDRISLSFASPWMIERLLEEFLLLQMDHTRTLVSILLEDHRKLATATGVMFESLVHHILSTVPTGYENKSRFELKEFDLGHSPPRRAKDNPHAICIGHIVRERDVEWYFTPCPPDFDPKTYFVPNASNNPTFDAVVYESRTTPKFIGPIRGRAESRAYGSERSVSAASSGVTVCEDGDMKASNIDFERATGRFNGRSASAGTCAASSIPPAGPSPTPFELSRSRSRSCVSGGRWLSSPRTWAPDETTPGVKVIKRKRSAMDRPATGNKEPAPNDNSQHCIALQMTVAATHSVALDGLRRLQTAFDPRRGTWSFVFVTPKSRPMDWQAQIEILMKLPDEWRDRFRWYNLIVDITNPGFLDLGIDTADRGPVA